jgi:hypothetical protein
MNALLQATGAGAAGFWDCAWRADWLATRIEPRIGGFPSPAGSERAGVYQSRGWLAAMERISPEATHYVVATEAGIVRGVLPVYLLDPAAAGHYHPRLAFGLPGEVDGPIAVLGGRAGYMTGWVLGADKDSRIEILAALLTSAASLATDHGARILTAQYLTAGDAALLARTGLVQPDEVIPHAALATIELPGTDFDDYLSSLSAARRSTVRRDLARFARSGLSMGTCRLSQSLAFAPGLLAAVAAKHGGQPDVARMQSALREQAAELDEVSVVAFAAPPGGPPVAYSLSYVYGDTLFVRLAGLDHDRAQASAAYFVATYYEPIRLAYRLGLRAVNVGIISYRPKVLRGAVVSPLYGVLRPADRTPLSTDRRAAVGDWLLTLLHDDLGTLAPPASTFAPVDWTGTVLRPGRGAPSR